MNALPTAPLTVDPSPLASLDLRDIHAAAVPEFWPLAPGWWLLALLVLAVLIVSSWWLIKIWRQRKHEARILSELDTLAESSPADAATQISTLMRRVALMRFKRIDVASLSGNDWLGFLDDTGGNGDFVNGAGSELATVPYSVPTTVPGSNESNNEALLSLARQWIHINLGKKK